MKWSDVEITEVPDGDGPFTRIGLRLGQNKFAGVDIFSVDGSKLCSLNIFEWANGSGDVDVILPDGKSGKLILMVDGVKLETPDTSQVSVFGVDFS